jgi:hypothetical protein
MKRGTKPGLPSTEKVIEALPAGPVGSHSSRNGLGEERPIVKLKACWLLGDVDVIAAPVNTAALQPAVAPLISASAVLSPIP